MSAIESVLEELRAVGNEKTRITYSRHGIPADRSLGVSMAELKRLAKSIKGRQDLVDDLYETGIMEPMYLAGIVAKGGRRWADRAEKTNDSMLSG